MFLCFPESFVVQETCDNQLVEVSRNRCSVLILGILFKLDSLCRRMNFSGWLYLIMWGSYWCVRSIFKRRATVLKVAVEQTSSQCNFTSGWVMWSYVPSLITSLVTAFGIRWSLEKFDADISTKSELQESVRHVTVLHAGDRPCSVVRLSNAPLGPDVVTTDLFDTTLTCWSNDSRCDAKAFDSCQRLNDCTRQ